MLVPALAPALAPLIIGSLTAAAAGTSILLGTLPMEVDLPEDVKSKKCFTRATVISDLKTLREAVESLGGSAVNHDLFRLDGVEFVLRRDPQEIFTWNDEFNEQQANEFISGIEAEYIRIVRDKTLANVSEHCKECGLELESEEVEEDETVVLTFRV